MSWMLRISLPAALLLSGWLNNGAILRAQEPATIDSEPAVRFEQSPGYFHYAAFCRTPKAFTAQMPKSGLPLDQIEYGIGWYVTGSVTRTAGAAGVGSPEIDGRIVVSLHHVRFMPSSPQFAAQYFDIPHGEVELEHSPGQPDAILKGKDVALSFQLRKICQTCAAGAPVPSGLNTALLDQEFALLDDTLKQFESGWRKTYRLSKGGSTEIAAGNRPAGTEPHPGREANRSADLNTRQSPAINFERSVKPASLAASHARVSMSAPTLGLPAGRPVRITSWAADGLLVRKVPPSYPLEAKLVRLEGTVVVKAVIDRSGEVSEVNALSGPPLLESAAVDAVKQWQYHPYAVNGQPVDVETTIEVVFALDASRSAARGQTARR